MVRRSSLILAAFLVYTLSIGAPCYCATHGSGAVAAESHACCQTDTTARTSLRSTCCCDDRDQPQDTAAVPDSQGHVTPVFVAVIDALGTL